MDTNELFYNCGHYPEWDVTTVDGPLPVEVPTTRRGTPLAYERLEDAEAACCRLNKASRAAWRAFLNG